MGWWFVALNKEPLRRTDLTGVRARRLPGGRPTTNEPAMNMKTAIAVAAAAAVAIAPLLPMVERVRLWFSGREEGEKPLQTSAAWFVCEFTSAQVCSVGSL